MIATIAEQVIAISDRIGMFFQNLGASELTSTIIAGVIIFAIVKKIAKTALKIILIIVLILIYLIYNNIIILPF